MGEGEQIKSDMNMNLQAISAARARPANIYGAQRAKVASQIRPSRAGTVSRAGKTGPGYTMVKLKLEAGKASPAPPIGPLLGSIGVNIGQFVKQYNAMTANLSGEVPCQVWLYADKSMEIKLRKASTPTLLKKYAGIEKGSNDGNVDIQEVGKITTDQLREIAEMKMPDLNCKTIEAAERCISGTARNMGIRIVSPEKMEELLEQERKAQSKMESEKKRGQEDFIFLD